MKKNGILNREINDVLGKLGHTDKICICDCGLPLPDGVKVIDLSLTIGIPSFVEVLKVALEEMEVEKYYLAKEIFEHNLLGHDIKDLLLKDKKSEVISHEAFKELTKSCKVIIRTGEATPYANIIFESGVIF